MTQEFMERDFMVCYWLDDIQHVPHFVTPNIFVAPGGIERTEKYLLDAGAIKATAYLWPRRWLAGTP